MSEIYIKEQDAAFDAFVNECVTLVGMHHYYGGSQIDRGAILRCEKERDNEVDQEAIKVMLPVVGTVGYLANNTFTVIKGTQSAGRIYDKVGDHFYVRVLFRDEGKAIAQLMKGDEAELYEQWKDKFFDVGLDPSK